MTPNRKAMHGEIIHELIAGADIQRNRHYCQDIYLIQKLLNYYLNF